MSRVVTRARPPWMLPVILAVMVAIIVLLVIFRTQIKNAFSSATATPTAVATATPSTSGATSTPGAGAAAVPPTATAGALGISTPVPGATPQPTRQGLKVGMITRPQATVADLQQRATRGDPAYTFYLDPRMVVQNTLPHYGFTQSFEIVAPNPSPTPTPYVGADKRPLIKFLIAYQSGFYTVYVAQPAVHGPKGIWVIVTINVGKT